jgi:hypothetical protein
MCNKFLMPSKFLLFLKGHGNEADFLGFLQKLGSHRSLTLPFEPLRFWLRFRGDIRNRKMTPRLGESANRRLSESAFECLNGKIGESESRRLPGSANGGVAMVSRGVAIQIF